MKTKNLMLVFLTSASVLLLDAQTFPTYKVVTVVESIVPAGLGRSRMIENQTNVDVDDFTTGRTDGKKKQSKWGQEIGC